MSSSRAMGFRTKTEHLPESRCIESVEEGIAEGLARSGNRSLAVIPEGPYVVPRMV